MKTMKKLVAALLVLTMVLALTGSAFAACIKVDDYVKFTKNSYAFKDTKHGKKKVTGPEVIVRRGSVGKVMDVCGGYALVQLTPAYDKEDWPQKQIGNTEDSEGNKAWCYWFKTSTLKVVANGPISVTFSNGGNGKSLSRFLDEQGKALYFEDKGQKLEEAIENCEDYNDVYEVLAESDGEFRLSPDCNKHVKANAKVWMHKTPSLSHSYGKALRKGDKVTYRRKWGVDTRFTIFYGIKYKGKCLWVSEAYTKIVK